MTAVPTSTPTWSAEVVAQAAESGSDIDTALRLALTVGDRLPMPGSGRTRMRWSVLTDLARANVTVARVVEAHTDALAIRAEAGMPDDERRTWGVFAAEGPDARLVATPTDHHTVTLSGAKPWCSLGDVLDAALVTAWIGDERQLFEVDLQRSGVSSRPAAGWVSRGLPTVTSVGLEFDQVPARPVGAPAWYLRRPGFAWGGMGVAACWHGGALAVADALARGRQDDIGALHAGRVDVAMHAASCVLDAAAAAVDTGAADGAAGELLALRVRAVVAESAERVLREVGQHAGPAPLAFDERHAAHVADLQIYLRQHHGERDLASLGRALRAGAR